MTKRLTTEQLEAIRKRAEAAIGRRSIQAVYPTKAFNVLAEDIPALLAEVERLQGIVYRISGPLTIEGVAADGRRIKMEGVKLNIGGGESDD